MAKSAKLKLPKMTQPTKLQRVNSPKHFAGMVIGFSEIFRLEKFCDVKLVCQDSELMAHRLMLGSFSPFLRVMMEEKEERGENVVTIHLPLIKGYHMKLVLDYIYGGSMYLCGAHMKYIIQVMEVLQLECGISVNKMVLNQEADKSGNHWTEIEQTEVKLQHFTPGKWKNEEKDNGEEKQEESHKETVSSDDKKCDNNAKDVSNDKEMVEDKENSEDEDSVKDDDIDDAPVVVELDERFVVECGEDSHESGESGEESNRESGEAKKEHTGHKCLLCKRSFKHYWNLQVHLKGHVGVKVHLNRCDKCKKNFRNKTEHDLHQRSHLYAKALGKVRLSKAAILRAKIITTSGSQDKKIVRKYSKNLPKPVIVSKKSDKEVRVSQDSLTCPICEKSFGVKSLYLRHVKQKHPELADTLEQRILLQRKAFVRVKNQHFPHLLKKRKLPTSFPPESLQTPTKKKKSVQFSTPISSSTKNKHSPSDSPASSSILSPSSPRSSKHSPLNGETSPGSPFTPSYPKLKTKNKRRIESSPESSSSSSPRYPNNSPKKREKSSYYCDLTCPDCDRNFPAKSIFERHLQTAKHGEYSLYSSDSGSPVQKNSPSTSTHWSQQMIRVGDKEIPKIECHLCNSTFARVKDLAKHREKVCDAWLNPVH